MLSIILLAAGIAAVIVRANTGIIIADWIIWVLFGLSGIGFAFHGIMSIIAAGTTRKIHKQIGRFRL